MTPRAPAEPPGPEPFRVGGRDEVKTGETLLPRAGEHLGETEDGNAPDGDAVGGRATEGHRHRLKGPATAFVRSRWAPLAVLVCFGVLLAVAVWPGQLDADALNQIKQARTGQFNNWWAPIIDWLMRGLFLLGGGPGIVVMVTILVALVSLYELLRVRLSRWSSVLVSVLISISPPVLGYITSLQRDVWFGSATLASYALLVRATRCSPRARSICAGLSLVAAWFAMAARQNAIPALIPAVAIDLAWLLRPRRTGTSSEPSAVSAGTAAEPDPATAVDTGDLVGPASAKGPSRSAGSRARRRRTGRRPLAIAVLTVAVFGVFYLSQDVLTYDVIGAVHAYPQQELFEQDLAGISLREHVDLLPRAIFPAHSLAVLSRYYSPATVIPLVAGKGHPLITYADASGYKQLEKAWEHAVVHHPIGYLHARWNLWMAEIDWNVNSWAPYHPGVDKNTLGLSAAFPVLDKFRLRYLETFGTTYLYGGVVTKAWIYLLISPFLGLSLARRRRSAAVRIIGLMVLAAFVYTLTFAVAAMGDTFRWNWFLVTATLTGLVIQASESLRAAVDRRVEARSTALSAGHAAPVPPASGAKGQ